MKNKLHYMLVILITSILLSSCANKMSLMKRKYNKGYYIAHSHKNTTQKQEQPVALVKKANSIKELEVSSVEPELRSEPVITEKVVAFLPETKEVSTNTTKSTRAPGIVNTTFKSIQKIAPKKLQQQIAAKTPGDGGLVAATLSLFWIVLVVILILYLFGLVFDGFGLGWAIHLLAVIFLVLLILWLLGAV